MLNGLFDEYRYLRLPPGSRIMRSCMRKTHHSIHEALSIPPPFSFSSTPPRTGNLGSKNLNRKSNGIYLTRSYTGRLSSAKAKIPVMKGVSHRRMLILIHFVLTAEALPLEAWKSGKGGKRTASYD